MQCWYRPHMSYVNALNLRMTRLNKVCLVSPAFMAPFVSQSGFTYLLSTCTTNMLHEEAIFTLFEMTPDLVCIVNREGYFQKINPAVSATLGFTTEELMAFPVARFIHPDDKERTAINRSRLLKGEPLLNFQNRYVTKNGNTVWLEWTSVYLHNSELVFAIAKNITAGKLAGIAMEQNVLTLHRLNHDVKRHSEKERREIAGTLHEDLGQIAAAIKLKMEWLNGQVLVLSPPNSELVTQTLRSTNQLLNKLRDLSYSLSAEAMFLYGLSASLDTLCKEFTKKTGVFSQFKSRYREGMLSEEEKLDLYRICQEALENVAKHANATKVSVYLRRTVRGVLLTIADNGCGFDPVSVNLSGISVMTARALSIQGTLTVNSSSNGTAVAVLLKKRSAATQ